MEKGGKADRSPYINLKSENSQDDAQEKTKRNCTFMNLAFVLSLRSIPHMYSVGPVALATLLHKHISLKLFIGL